MTTKVIANFHIQQTIGSLIVDRPFGSRFDMDDTEAASAIAAGIVRAAPTVSKPAVVAPAKMRLTKVEPQVETK